MSLSRVQLYLFAILVAGCNSDEIRENACAEIGATRVFESSKRMEILKSYGMTPVQAQIFESALIKNQEILSTISVNDPTDPLDVKGKLDALQRQNDASYCMAINELSCTSLFARVKRGAKERDLTSSISDFLTCYDDPSNVERIFGIKPKSVVEATSEVPKENQVNYSGFKSDLRSKPELKDSLRQMTCEAPSNSNDCLCFDKDDAAKGYLFKFVYRNCETLIDDLLNVE